MEDGEKNNEKEFVQPGEERIPLCPHCLTPYKPLQNYCENCRNAVGKYTPYIPFVNIPFNVSIVGPMWKSLFDRKVSIPRKVFYVFLLIILYLGVWPLLLPVILIGLFVRFLSGMKKLFIES